MSAEDWKELESSLKTLPGSVGDAYEDSKALMSEIFSDDELLLWGKLSSSWVKGIRWWGNRFWGRGKRY